MPNKNSTPRKKKNQYLTLKSNVTPRELDSLTNADFVWCEWCSQAKPHAVVRSRYNQTRRGDKFGRLEHHVFRCDYCGHCTTVKVWRLNEGQLSFFQISSEAKR